MVEVRAQIEGEESRQFQFIKPSLLAIRDDNLRHHECACEENEEGEWAEVCDIYDGATVKYKSERGVFQAVAIMPSACTLALAKCRSLLVFDSTHYSSKYRGILLVVTTMDADEQTLVLA